MTGFVPEPLGADALLPVPRKAPRWVSGPTREGLTDGCAVLFGVEVEPVVVLAVVCREVLAGGHPGQVPGVVVAPVMVDGMPVGARVVRVGSGPQVPLVGQAMRGLVAPGERLVGHLVVTVQRPVHGHEGVAR